MHGGKDAKGSTVVCRLNIIWRLQVLLGYLNRWSLVPYVDETMLLLYYPNHMRPRCTKAGFGQEQHRYWSKFSLINTHDRAETVSKSSVCREESMKSINRLNFSFFASVEGLVALLTCPLPTIVYPKEVDF